MIINYEVWKYIIKNGKPVYSKFGGKSKEIKRGQIEIENIDWDSNEDHKKIRQAIYEKNPGYSICAYCEKNV